VIKVEEKTKGAERVNPGSDPSSDPGWDPSSNPSSDPGSNPSPDSSSDPGSDPGFILSLSRWTRFAGKKIQTNVWKTRKINRASSS